MRARSLSREAKAAFEPGGTTDMSVFSMQLLETTQERIQKTDRAVLADIPGTELASKETRKTERDVYASKLSSIMYSAKSEVFCLFYSRSLKNPKGTVSAQDHYREYGNFISSAGFSLFACVEGKATEPCLILWKMKYTCKGYSPSKFYQLVMLNTWEIKSKFNSPRFLNWVEKRISKINEMMEIPLNFLVEKNLAPVSFDIFLLWRVKQPLQKFKATNPAPLPLHFFYLPNTEKSELNEYSSFLLQLS
ncbi:hypothetical protein DUI87_09980 [Hirundo rustica rustica]|uniref:Uncharacterized protein n=1 Tax=Hirundo rustica rustica TaxID=333673 RepID=A0A3M0KH29_HIRRU|nr:hypothetical protein DUI87_09980 [Hirundo rustica rustica]